MAVVEPSSPPASGIAHVLAFPYSAQGHLNPLMRLCKTLASHNILITFVTLQPFADRLLSAPSSTSALPLPPATHRRASIAFADLNLTNDFSISFRNLSTAADKIGDALLQLIARLAKEGPPVTCILSDFVMSTTSQEVADQLNLPRVALFPSSQSFNLFFYHIYKGVVPLEDGLHATLKNDTDLFHDALPGLPPLRNIDVPHFRHLRDETEYIYRFSVHQTDISTKRAVMFVVNSFQELEGPAFDIMSNDVPVFPVGPLIEDLDDQTNTSRWKEDEDCLKWLDEQPAGSVLYISFGSITILSKKQFEEIFLGLEASNQRFLLSFRADLLAGASCNELPEEFRARTKDRGYTVSWAPQTRVLAHPSVGGFLTHCGWNSVIEAVAKGVPMACWPYFADQFMICKFVVEEWKAGMRFEGGRGGIVGRAEVERVVRALMEGEEGEFVSKNVARLSEAGRRSLETGGSSDRHVQALVRFLLQRP